MAPYTTTEFIEKARQRHGDKYSYDRCVYVGSRTKLVVTCSDHGDFDVVGASHLNGNGCAKCVQATSKTAQTYTTEAYVAKCKEKFGDLYDYSETVYVFSKDKVKIRCREHGIFEKAACLHLFGRGCPSCGKEKGIKDRVGIKMGKAIVDTEDLVERARALHGDKYCYDYANYIDCETKVDLTCPDHGPFAMLPRHHVNPKRPCGCPKCGIIKAALNRSTGVEKFIEQARQVHGDRYDYGKVEYGNCDSNISIFCRLHGEFKQTPYHHIKHKSGCPSCGGTVAYTNETFVAAARRVHGSTFDYSKVQYRTAHDKVAIICGKHGEFQQTAFQHLKGHGCQKCWFAAGASKMQIDWLELVSVQLRRQVQHARNQGEFKIPGSRFSVDGYDEETNTVYEFLGKFFHSDPRVHRPDEWNKLLNITHGDNYKKTMARENYLRNAGYHVVNMWEVDWLQYLHSVKLIQKHVRRRLYRY